MICQTCIKQLALGAARLDELPARVSCRFHLAGVVKPTAPQSFRSKVSCMQLLRTEDVKSVKLSRG
jgi:hypothetical protein